MIPRFCSKRKRTRDLRALLCYELRIYAAALVPLSKTASRFTNVGRGAAGELSSYCDPGTAIVPQMASPALSFAVSLPPAGYLNSRIARSISIIPLRLGAIQVAARL